VPLTKVCKSAGACQATYKVVASRKFHRGDRILRNVSPSHCYLCFSPRLIEQELAATFVIMALVAIIVFLLTPYASMWYLTIDLRINISLNVSNILYSFSLFSQRSLITLKTYTQELFLPYISFEINLADIRVTIVKLREKYIYICVSCIVCIFYSTREKNLHVKKRRIFTTPTERNFSVITATRDS